MSTNKTNENDTTGIGQAEYSTEILSVNGKQIKVNKYLLAYNSSHFDDIFFGNDCKNEENKIIQIAPATPEHFQRMLDAMKPKDRPVDDQCLEGVYHLAKQFFVHEVEGKCRNFLWYESKHSAIFKYRLANKYGLFVLKQQILDSSRKEDFFNEVNFVENLWEYAILDEPAREALATRLGQLFDQSPSVLTALVMDNGQGMSGRWPRMSEFAGRPGAAVLLVNEKEVRVNKNYLAYKSEFFARFFFGEDSQKNTKVEIWPPATVEDFKRMMDTMEPWNRPLDDGCIEPVLHLANRFFVLEVEEKCHNFLAEKSNHLAIFKYRLVNKYCSDQLKVQLLKSLKKADFFKEANFVDNLEEFAKLDRKARLLLSARLGQLFVSK